MAGRFCVVLLAGLALSACESERRPPPPPIDDKPENVVPWKMPDDVAALVTDEPFGTSPMIDGTRRAPDCWEWLERNGEPLDPFPYSEPLERATQLASCGIEARHVFDDGSHIVAWGSEEKAGSRVRDLRVARWDKNGKLRWAADMDRSRQAANWTANYRSSFVTVLPNHVCAGTLWEGDTQVICVDPATGQEAWSGSLPFWSGVAPQPADDGLMVADLSAITKRYPFNGSEMRHKKLEGLGGRAGYYATDGKHLYFAPSRVDAPPLIAYDMAGFKELWRTPLPGAPSATLAHAWKQFGRALLKVDDNLVAVDTKTGKVVWAYEIGEDVPSVDADDDSIYVLSRRPDLPNRLTALNPSTGERRWATDTPAGTLRVLVMDGFLFIGSLRAVQHVTPPTEVAVQESPDGG